jgi:hypothetical protein
MLRVRVGPAPAPVGHQMTHRHHPGPVLPPPTEPRRSRGRRVPTQSYLSAEAGRVPVIELLDRTLADTSVPLTHAEYAHCNPRGMESFGLPQLVDEIAQTRDASMDAPPPDSQGPSVQ